MLLPITNYQLPITNYLLPVTYYLLPIIGYGIQYWNLLMFSPIKLKTVSYASIFIRGRYRRITRRF
ncbi:MAG: hypothetical protein ACLBM4_24510, partial [Dolichospermum sp.]